MLVLIDRGFRIEAFPVFVGTRLAYWPCVVALCLFFLARIATGPGSLSLRCLPNLRFDIQCALWD